MACSRYFPTECTHEQAPDSEPTPQIEKLKLKLAKRNGQFDLQKGKEAVTQKSIVFEEKITESAATVQMPHDVAEEAIHTKQPAAAVELQALEKELQAMELEMEALVQELDKVMQTATMLTASAKLDSISTYFSMILCVASGATHRLFESRVRGPRCR